MINKCSDPTCSVCGSESLRESIERDAAYNANPYGKPKIGPDTVRVTVTLSTKARVAMFIFGWFLIVASFFCLGLVYLPWTWLASLHGQAGYLVVVRVAFALTMIVPIVYVGLGILRTGVITVADSIMHK